MPRNLLLKRRVLLAAGCVGTVLFAQQPGAQNNPGKLEKNTRASMPEASPAPKQNAANVTFPGAVHFQPNALRTAIAEQIQTIGDQGLTPANADDAAFFLGIFYRKNGYSQVDVKWRIAGARALVLDVAEGPLTALGNVSFHGIAGLPENTLRDYIVGTTRERFPRTKKAATLPFVQSDVDTGVERIRGLYASEGFLNAVVDPPVVSLSQDKTRADINVTVREGMRYRFGKLDFTGDIVFFPNTELSKTLEPFSKKPYTPAQVTNMQRAVVYYYKTHGYLDPKVAVESDPTKSRDGAVPVLFRIESGNVYRFDGVTQEGLDRLSVKFLPNRFASLHNKFYSPQALDEKFREMMRTGLFKQLRIEPRPLPDNTLELHMKVEEAKAKELGFGLGYGTFEGPIVAFSAGDRNLFGSGRPLTSTVEISQRFLRGEIVYADPWLFESDYALRTSLFARSESFQGFTVTDAGLRAELRRKITKQLEATAFVQARKASIQNDGIEPELLGPRSYLENDFGTTITFDMRDSAINPGRGFVAAATGDYAANVLGNAVQFLRGTMRFSYYLPIKKTLLAFGARGGALYPEGNNKTGVPIDERFFNGGSRSVRSFPERELGPQDRHGIPVGGDSFTVFNVEYQFPLVGDLIGALFFDAGSVGRDAGSVGKMRYGIGPGLRYRSPVGPLRIDYGINPSPGPHEHFGALHISFGTAF